MCSLIFPNSATVVHLETQQNRRPLQMTPNSASSMDLPSPSEPTSFIPLFTTSHPPQSTMYSMNAFNRRYQRPHGQQQRQRQMPSARSSASAAAATRYPAIEQKIRLRKENMGTIIDCLQELKELGVSVESECGPQDPKYQKNQEEIKKIDKLTRDLINLSRKVDMQNQALGKFKEVSRIDGDPEMQFKKFVENARKKSGPYKTDKQFMKDESYQSFYSGIRRVHHPEEKMPWHKDDDIILEDTGAAPTSFMCVITQEDFVDPVKAPCGHTYSKEGILDLLKASGRMQMPCPVAGCNKMVTESSLEPDVQMRVLQERSQRRTQATQQQESSAPSNALNLDSDSDSDMGF